MELKRVLLPEPFGPIRPVMLPRGTMSDTSLLAVTPPNDLHTPLSSMTASLTANPPGAPQGRCRPLHRHRSPLRRTWAQTNVDSFQSSSQRCLVGNRQR